MKSRLGLAASKAAMLAVGLALAGSAWADADGRIPVVIAYSDYAYEGVPGTDLLALAASVREFGGSLKDVPVWVMYASGRVPSQELRDRASSLSVELLPYTAPRELSAFPFAQKAAAAAEAERLAESRALQLVWFDRDSLVLKEPARLLLAPGEALAFRPVNGQNIGQEPASAPDAFWSAAYRLGGADPGTLGTTVSYMEGKSLRFYMAAGLMALRPERGIFRRWLELELLFAADTGMAAVCRGSARHLLFMHQAALSVAVATSVREDERRVLPPEFMYPLNFWTTDTAGRRPMRVDDLVTLRYDAALEGDGWRSFPMSPELSDWMETHL